MASPTQVRLYGRAGAVCSWGSHAVVTEGFRGVLEKHDLLAGVVELGKTAQEWEDLPPGATAEHGILTGPLGMAPTMTRNAKHERRWAMVAPNSNRMPEELCAVLRSVCTDVLVPSQWAAGVLDQYAVPCVQVVPHGVSEEYRLCGEARLRAHDQYRSEIFLVSHLSSSARQRKGTIELVQAWAAAVQKKRLPIRAQLDLVLDADAANALLVAVSERNMELPPGVVLRNRVDFSAQQMAMALSRAHVLCQPSRGEGFGLVPLEARACGVPVVATLCTGHSEHMSSGDPGVVEIAHGTEQPIDDLPGAAAPSVEPESIETALVAAYEGWEAFAAQAERNASAVAAQWSWENQLAPWIAALQ